MEIFTTILIIALHVFVIIDAVSKVKQRQGVFRLILAFIPPVIGPIIFYGSIWVVLTWRCFAVTSICNEVAEGKTTKDALFFQLFQVCIFIFGSYRLLSSGTKDIPTIITAISLIITSVWYIYSISKTGLQLKKNRQNKSSEPTLKTPGDSVDV